MSVTDDQKYEELLALLREIRAVIRVPAKLWLSPEEAADYLGVSRSRVYQYIRSDRIPFYRLPDSRQVRLNRIDLDEWVRNGSKATRIISDEQIRRILN